MRYIKIEGRKYYAAKDIVESMGFAWHSRRTIKNLVSEEHIFEGYVPQDNKEHYMILVDFEGKRIIEYNLKQTPKTAKELNAKKQVEAMKNMLSNLVVSVGKDIKSGLKSSKKSAIVAKRSDVLQKQARTRVRAITETYAERRMKELEITDPTEQRLMYNLAYNALYDTYKNQSTTDLKALAEQQGKKAGHHISALEVAENTGKAIELCTLAESIFGQ